MMEAPWAKAVCTAALLSLLSLLTAGCTHARPGFSTGATGNGARPRWSDPRRAASTTWQVAPTRPPAPAAPAPSPGPTPQPQSPTKPQPPTKPPTPTTDAPPVTETATTSPTLDLKVLEERLRRTKAIGVFTKLTLKNQIDDLLDRFRDYYKGKGKDTMKDLRRSFDLLLMKVLSLLQDEDEALASAIVSSREALWALLADPKTFATVEG